MKIAWQDISLWSKFGTNIRSRVFLDYSELRISRLSACGKSKMLGEYCHTGACISLYCCMKRRH